MRILVSSVTNTARDILYAHLSTILKQRVEKHIEVDYLYVLDPAAPPETKEVLDFLAIPTVLGTPKEAGAAYAVSETTHHWEKPTFYWLGLQKQKLLDYAAANAYDALFLCDSDLLCDPGTLQSLIDCNKPIVSANFWTRWTPDAPPLPQCWQEHPYEMQGRGWEAHEHLEALSARKLIPVGGLGACTLINKDVLTRAHFWPPQSSLPEGGMWQGEDRTFCISAQRNHVPLYADGWSDVFHWYRPSDLGRVPEVMEGFQSKAPRGTPVRRGMLVSAILTPIEAHSEGEQRILRGFEYHLRGRVGELKVVPSLETALLQMKSGEEKFVKLSFPIHYPIPEFRMKTRTIKVKVLDVREDTPPLGLELPLDVSVFYAER